MTDTNRIRRAQARRIRPAAAAIMGLATLTACSEIVERTPVAVEYSTQIVATLPPAERRVIEDIQTYLQDPNGDRAVISAGQQSLIQRCMRAAGFVYQTVPFHSIVIDLGADNGPVPVEAPTAQTPFSDPNASESNSAAWFTTFSNDTSSVAFDLPGGSHGGMATGGCLGESLHTLYGPELTEPVRQEMLATNLLPRIVKTASDTATVRAAALSRTTCLAAAGWPSADPAETGTAARPPAAEDARCRRSSHLPEAYAAAFRDVAHDVLVEASDVIKHWRDTRVAAAQVAATIVRN